MSFINVNLSESFFKLSLHSSSLVPKDIAKPPKHEIESYINEPLKSPGNLSDYVLAVPKAESNQSSGLLQVAGTETLSTETTEAAMLEMLLKMKEFVDRKLKKMDDLDSSARQAHSVGFDRGDESIDDAIVKEEKNTLPGEEVEAENVQSENGMCLSRGSFSMSNSEPTSFDFSSL